MTAEVNHDRRDRVMAAYHSLRVARLGTPGYLCILAYIETGPATTPEIAAAFGLSEQTAREVIQRMGELRMAHVEGSRRRADRGPAHPLWVSGPGPIPRRLPCREKLPVLMQLKHILATMQDPARVTVIAKVCGSTEATVSAVVKLGRRLGLCHIAAWEASSSVVPGGKSVAAWVVGAGVDAVKPKPMGMQECNRRRQRATAAKDKAARILFALAGRRQPEECGVAA